MAHARLDPVLKKTGQASLRSYKWGSYKTYFTVRSFKILRYQGINLRSFVHVVHTPFSPSITSVQCLGITQLFEMVRVVVFTISNYSFAETVK